MISRASTGRNAGGCGLSGLGRTVRSDGDNDRYLPADEIGGERRQSIDPRIFSGKKFVRDPIPIFKNPKILGMVCMHIG